MNRIDTREKKIGKASLICGIIVASLFALSLSIRVIPPYDSVLSGTFVRFSGNQPWYSMRLVENTLHNFPHRIYFDAFTNYPHGTSVPVAPLFDYSLAVIIWIIGLGNPFATLGQHGIEVIGAWYPAVLGALIVIPVYFIGKELWSRPAGLLSAALIAILPGPFLNRSLLGFTDHDIAGVLFSALAILFLIMALKRAKEKEITFYSVWEKDCGSLRGPMTYSILAGISLGSYYLAWKGAPLHVFILLIYAVVQYIMDHVRGKSTDYLSIVGIPVFLIALVMIAPVLHPGALIQFHVISLLLAMLVFGFLSAVSFLMHTRKIGIYGYPIAIVTLGVLSFVLLRVLSPSLYLTLTGALSIFVPSETALTVAEIHGMRVVNSSLGNPGAWEWFTTTFFIAFIAFLWIGYSIARKFRAEEMLFLVWSAVMLYACVSQNRFAAYYALNVALLCGFLSWKMIERVGLRREGGIGKARSVQEEKKEENEDERAGGEAMQKAEPGVNGADKEMRIQTVGKKWALRAGLIVTVLLICFVFFYPPLFFTPDHGSAPGTFYYSARHGGEPGYDWYESLSWMKENTPDPGVDYYELYDEPGVNKTTNRREDYDYPPEAYSVISWWDYGHWITRVARRIPVANPFQAGIGGPIGSGNPGACVFFIGDNEAEANEVADALGVRYVVSDFMMADMWNALYNKYSAMTTWAGDRERYNTPSYYYTTMGARLHLFDGARVVVEGEPISALAHYRLVHESPRFILPLFLMNETTGRAYPPRHLSGDYNRMASQARIFHGDLFSIGAGAGIEEDLNSEVMPEMLKDAFNTRRISLAAESTVVKLNEQRWVIHDETNNNAFIIEKREGMLDVYLFGVGIEPGVNAWTPRHIAPVGFVKVFEYVKGARIEGTAPEGTVVELSTNITTNQGREFVYAERKRSNGTYEFIVPYSTEGPMKGGTNFDVFALPYTIRTGRVENETVVWEMEREVSVPEEAVIEGKTIKADLLS